MAYNEATRARARALYESGLSLVEVAKELDIDDLSVLHWKQAGEWIKGRSRLEIEQEQHKLVVEAAAKHGLTKERILQELAILATVDSQDLYEEDSEGNKRLKKFKDMGSASRAIRSIKTKTTRRFNAKNPEDVIEETTNDTIVYDKGAALIEAGNILGIKKDGDDTQDVFKSFFDGLASVVKPQPLPPL